jgi:hypothetical protein
MDSVLSLRHLSGRIMILRHHGFMVFLDTPTKGQTLYFMIVLYGYLYVLHTSRKVFIVSLRTSHTEVENQFTKGIKGL